MEIIPLAVCALALFGIAWRLLVGRSASSPSPNGNGIGNGNGAAASVSRELTRLDPFSFFVLSGQQFGADHVVVGPTGAFVIRVGHASVDGDISRDLAETRRAAKRVKQGAGVASIHTGIQPVLALPGRQFPPRTDRGVKVIPWGMVVAEVADRQRTVSSHQVQRVAEALGGLPRPRAPIS
jgi:hypothetical protein